jgi:hypothetical protein
MFDLYEGIFWSSFTLGFISGGVGLYFLSFLYSLFSGDR